MFSREESAVHGIYNYIRTYHLATVVNDSIPIAWSICKCISCVKISARHARRRQFQSQLMIRDGHLQDPLSNGTLA
jgi:hypothetical protein